MFHELGVKTSSGEIVKLTAELDKGVAALLISFAC